MNVLFVCTGNICRSPLAEGILREKYRQKGISATVDSCGFESFHIGDPPDPRAQKIAKRNGIDISGLRARLFSRNDLESFDKIFVMDRGHYHSIMRYTNTEEERRKIDFVQNVVYPRQDKPVNDPYYDDITAFETVYDQLNEACDAIANQALIHSNK